jgi:membrane protein required for colicin V production
MLQSLNFVDYGILLVILASGVYAAWRGFMAEALSVLAWIAAAFATLYFGPWAAPLLGKWISTHWLASLLGYVLVFLVVFAPLSFLSHRFSDSVRKSAAGAVDRLMGFLYGVVRGVVVVALAYLALSYAATTQPRVVKEAHFLPWVQRSSVFLIDLLPARDRPSFINANAGLSPSDDLGNLIRREDAADSSSPAKNTGPGAGKTYGARDRRALDTLLEATGKAATKP